MEGHGKKEKLRNENRCGEENRRADLVGKERKGKRESKMGGKTGKRREENRKREGKVRKEKRRK